MINSYVLRKYPQIGGFFKAEASLASLKVCHLTLAPFGRRRHDGLFCLISLCVLSLFFSFVIDKNFADFLALQRMKFCVNCFFTFVVHVFIFCPFALSFSLSHCSFCRFTHTTAFLTYISSMFL